MVFFSAYCLGICTKDVCLSLSKFFSFLEIENLVKTKDSKGVLVLLSEY